jgi:hypothetical protein
MVDTVPYAGAGTISPDKLERILLGGLRPNIRAQNAPWVPSDLLLKWLGLHPFVYPNSCAIKIDLSYSKCNLLFKYLGTHQTVVHSGLSSNASVCLLSNQYRTNASQSLTLFLLSHLSAYYTMVMCTATLYTSMYWYPFYCYTNAVCTHWYCIVLDTISWSHSFIYLG